MSPEPGSIYKPSSEELTHADEMMTDEMRELSKRRGIELLRKKQQERSAGERLSEKEFYMTENRELMHRAEEEGVSIGELWTRERFKPTDLPETIPSSVIAALESKSRNRAKIHLVWYLIRSGVGEIICPTENQEWIDAGNKFTEFLAEPDQEKLAEDDEFRWYCHHIFTNLSMVYDGRHLMCPKCAPVFRVDLDPELYLEFIDTNNKDNDPSWYDREFLSTPQYGGANNAAIVMDPHRVIDIAKKFINDTPKSVDGWVHIKDNYESLLNESGEDARVDLEPNSIRRDWRKLVNDRDKAEIPELSREIEDLIARAQLIETSTGIPWYSYFTPDYKGELPTLNKNECCRILLSHFKGDELDRYKDFISFEVATSSGFGYRRSFTENFSYILDEAINKEKSMHEYISAYKIYNGDEIND